MFLPLRLVAVDGEELHVYEQGDGDAVVLVHGGGATDMRTWGPQIEPFAERYRVIAYSQRYHYPNVWSGDGSDVYDTARHAEDLGALITQLGIAPCHVVGSSYGCDIALLLAAEEPGLVRSLVLGEPGLAGWLRRLPGGDELLRDYEVSMTPAAQAVKAGDLETATRLFIDAALGPGLFEQLPAALHQRLRDNARLLAFEALWVSDQSPFDCTMAGRIQAPMLLLTGDSSPAMYGLVAGELARCAPGIERGVIPDAAHILHGMNPAAYNGAVLAFLGRH